MEEGAERHPRHLDPAGRGGDADPREAPGAAAAGGARAHAQAEDLGRTILFVATLPPRACVNELVISPTWNRFYLGGKELRLAPETD